MDQGLIIYNNTSYRVHFAPPFGEHWREYRLRYNEAWRILGKTMSICNGHRTYPYKSMAQASQVASALAQAGFVNIRVVVKTEIERRYQF